MAIKQSELENLTKDTQAFSLAVDTIISNNKKFKINDDIKKELLWMNKNQQLTEMVK